MSRTRMSSVLCTLIAMLLPGAAARADGEQSLHLDVRMGTTYDDNFLSLSGHQLADFAGGTHPLRYAISSTDDGLFEPSVSLTWELNEGRGRRHAVRLRGGGLFHARNSTADNNEFSARWTESFRHSRRFSLGYYRLNRYYVRQLRDEDLPAALGDYRYERVQFDLQIVSVAWRQRLGRRRHVVLAYQNERRDYVPMFRERTSSTHQGELGLEWYRLPHRGHVYVRGDFRVSNADARDGDEVGGVMDDDDLSYHGFEGVVAGRMEFARSGRWRFGGDLAYEIRTRAYDSKLATDRYHYHRNDLRNAFEAGLRLAFRPHWSLRTSYRIENNVARLGTSAPPTSDSGSYHVNQLALSIGWSGDIWNRVAADEDSKDEE